MVRKTKEEAQETRQRIIAAAEKAFFDRGVAHTTLEHVARAAGVTRGAIYWHFKNKVDLFSAMHEEVRMPMKHAFYGIVEEKDVDGCALQRLEEFCVASFLNLHEDERLRRVYTVLLLKCEVTAGMEALGERQLAAKQEVTEALTRFFTRAQQDQRLKPDTPPQILALALYAYMCGLFHDYLRSPQSYSMPEDARILIAYFFRPLHSKTGCRVCCGTEDETLPAPTQSVRASA